MNTSGPHASIGYHLWHAALAWRGAIGQALEPTGLTATQFFFLGALHWLSKKEGRLPTQRDLADAAGLDAMTTSQVVRTLEGKSLLQRRKHPEDQRAYAIELTDEGLRVAANAFPRVQAAEKRFFSDLSLSKSDFISELKQLSHERDSRITAKAQ